MDIILCELLHMGWQWRH